MGNRYDERYNFRMATVNDVDAIMSFIHDEWGESHILAHNKELFLWQYGASEYGDNEKINVVLMTEKNNGDIVGMIGFVPYSQDVNNLHISTAITKIKSRHVMPMAGIELMKRQNILVGEEANFASGTNPDTIMPIFEKVFHHRVGIMQQYYILNPMVEKFRVAKPDKEEYDDSFVPYSYSLQEIFDIRDIERHFDINKVNAHMSIKSKEYINKRFFCHPIYSYRKWFIQNSLNENLGVIFGREIIVDECKVLRLVDYRGDLEHLEKIGSAIRDLMELEGYEYIDLMVSDLSGYKLKEAGFNLLDPNGKTIIPHYFEPFVQENIKNHYQTNYDIVIFKADGDQDRPNTWKGE